ncbi:MAG TPA: GNAT family N-acetyltransferase [Cellvibrio sp.]
MDITTTYGEPEFRQFKTLIADQWPHAELPDWNQESSKLPKAVLAVRDGQVIGGLSFIWYPRPGGGELVLWINTLFIAPFHRKSGVASALVQFAMNERARDKEIFVYTTVPSLYLKLGWSLVSVDNEHHVLKYILRAA